MNSNNYLGGVLAGDIKQNDIVLMTSMDGAQLYEDKDSDCWLYLWIVVNLPPDQRYCKIHVLLGGFIPGPKKPKNLDSFLVVGFHHLSLLQKEGLKIWDTSRNEVFRSDVYLLFTTADEPRLVYWDGLVGHCGKNGCRLYCGVRGWHKDSRSHYYPALLLPNNSCEGTNHPDISSSALPPAGDQSYSENLIHVISSPNQRQFEFRRTETGITKAPLILGLSPSRSLGVPLCMTTDLMHLVANITELLITLWRGSITCAPTDNVDTWDWAVLRDEQVWQNHGLAVERAGQYIPGSFDAKPRNIAQQVNTDYKTWEFQLYTFGLAPALLHHILPDHYWINFCKLVKGFQLLAQHTIKHNEVMQAWVLLASWEREFKELYYQWRNDHLHFIRPCVHQILHLAPQTFQKGPPICSAQWTIERTIGNIKQEIRQPSNYLVNFMKEGVRCARVTALLAALPELADSHPRHPNGSFDLGNGYILLRKCDKNPVLPSHGTCFSITLHLNHRPFDPLPKIKRWAHLRLLNGQIARSAWREKETASNSLRVAHMVKVSKTIAYHISFSDTLVLKSFSWLEKSPLERRFISLDLRSPTTTSIRFKMLPLSAHSTYQMNILFGNRIWLLRSAKVLMRSWLCKFRIY